MSSALARDGYIQSYVRVRPFFRDKESSINVVNCQPGGGETTAGKRGGLFTTLSTENDEIKPLVGEFTNVFDYNVCIVFFFLENLIFYFTPKCSKICIFGEGL
jgi:hypothetical protein